MHTLYDYLPSGNGYKVRLILRLRGFPYQLVERDILKGETRTPEFLALNPNGRIPLLVFPDGRRLAESNAILCHLAEGSPFMPEDAWERAQVMHWLFWEQYSHEPCIATVRHWTIHVPPDTPEKHWLMEQKRAQGVAALKLMEDHLHGRKFFVGTRATIADIALYAYTHVAHEGGFDLSPYPALRAWLERVAGQPGMVPITQA